MKVIKSTDETHTAAPREKLRRALERLMRLERAGRAHGQATSSAPDSTARPSSVNVSRQHGTKVK